MIDCQSIDTVNVENYSIESSKIYVEALPLHTKINEILTLNDGIKLSYMNANNTGNCKGDKCFYIV